MIVCPNCKSKELDGAIFCGNCGARISHETDLMATQSIVLNDAPAVQTGFTEFPVGASTSALAWATLHMLDSGQLLPLSNRNEYSLGRISEGQPIMPDVDLTPFKAFDHGVSRLHAVLRRAENRVTVMDLGSANGTYYNGQRLAPNVEQPITNGDIVALGKLKIQILLSQIG